MASRTWRNICRPIIHEVLEQHKDCDEATIRKALLEAYPFGAREHHPYKIWLDEIKVQRKKKYSKTFKDTNQTNLF